MPRLSNSQSEWITRLKNRTIASFHAANPDVRDNGRNGTYSSTFLSRKTGASTERVTPTIGVAYDVSGCCTTTTA